MRTVGDGIRGLGQMRCVGSVCVRVVLWRLRRIGVRADVGWGRSVAGHGRSCLTLKRQGHQEQ